MSQYKPMWASGRNVAGWSSRIAWTCIRCRRLDLLHGTAGTSSQHGANRGGGVGCRILKAGCILGVAPASNCLFRGGDRGSGNAS
ncbi:hypothetical protein PR202_ga14716 [Eleusine coracana subsp. coracana]|uniref:Uncharacterized protein n=1 Tax=Eleusine coracana subsp. coracana TaxID=191504 RepID=A0AAV5CI80_ELECO|nr:hypothetical protein PR202_ga14716 [Eleusine coracana subsp. coracana]